MRFVADPPPEHWAGWEWLAELALGAGLTVEQAEAARLVVAGVTWDQLPGALSFVLGERVIARRARFRAWQAGIRLRRAWPHLAKAQRREAAALIGCVKNIRPHSPGLAVYPEKWGIVDREPVRFRSRLVGERPEDLIHHPLRFLRNLGRTRAV